MDEDTAFSWYDCIEVKQQYNLGDYELTLSYFGGSDTGRHLVLHFIIIVDVARFVEVAANSVDDKEEEGDHENCQHNVDSRLS